MWSLVKHLSSMIGVSLPTSNLMLLISHADANHFNNAIPKGSNACGVHDGGDTTCENLAHCTTVIISKDSKQSTCATITEKACKDQIDDLSEPIGRCRPLGYQQDVIQFSNDPCHQYPTAATCHHPESNHQCQWELSTHGPGYCYSLGTLSIPPAEYCDIFLKKKDCLSVAVGCEWQQSCENLEDLCDTDVNSCNAASGCHFDEGECKVTGFVAKYYRKKWLSAMTILIVTALSVLGPITLSRLFKRGYQLTEPFLLSASTGVLHSISMIHLMSESCLFQEMSERRGDNWVVFTCSLIAIMCFDGLLHLTSPSSNQHTSPETNDEVEPNEPIATLDQQPGGVPLPKSIYSVAFKYIGITVHSVLEGIVVGLQNAELTWILAIVIILHKILFSISLGQSLKEDPSVAHYCLTAMFVVSTPIGLIAAAYCIDGTNDVIFATLNAFSAATIFKFGLEGLIDLRDQMILYVTRLEEPVSDRLDIKIEEQPLKAETPPKKIASCSLFGWYGVHYLIMGAVSSCVFGLMCWHLSIHDHYAMLKGKL